MSRLNEIQRRYGGEISGGKLRMPTPGHSKHDNGTVISPHSTDPDDILVFCHNAHQSVANDLRLRILADLGLTKATAGQIGRKRTEYVYHDEDGNPLRKAVREEWPDPTKPKGRDKNIWQEHLLNGQRTNGAGTERNVPYRLPELLRASGTRECFITEGENKADKLAKMGFCATTNIGGAKGWKSEFNELFRDMLVYILEDNDDAGRERTETIASGLQGIAAQIKVIRFLGQFEGYDILDHLNGSDDRKRFSELKDAAEPYQPKPASSPSIGFGEVMDLSKPVPYAYKPQLVRGMLQQKGVAIIGGQSGSLKSFFCIDLSIRIATGEALGPHSIDRQGGVVYVPFEGEGAIADRVAARRKRMNNPEAGFPFSVICKSPPLSADDTYHALEARLLELSERFQKEFELPLVAFIIDTAVAAGMIPEDKENDAAVWQKVIGKLNGISERTGALAILVHHAGKNASAGLRGSSGIRAAADTVLMLSCDRDELTGETKNHVLALSKNREGEEGVIGKITRKVVEIGKGPDETPVTSLVLEIDTTQKVVERSKTEGKATKTFRKAFNDALIGHGESQHINGEIDSPVVKAVKLEHVKAAFEKVYVTGATDEKKRKDTLDRAFRRALQQATDNMRGRWTDTDWLWRSEDEG